MAVKPPRLGEETEYPESYDPGLLVSIPRAEGRSGLSIPQPMFGADLWTAYEISWLNEKGKPVVAVGEFEISADSQYIVESKSLKLYLNSLNQAQFSSQREVEKLITKDLSGGFGGEVAVKLFAIDDYASKGMAAPRGECLDHLDVECATYQPDLALLYVEEGEKEHSATLYSHLLKSNCPVTGQPDWATVEITYTGRPLNQQGLLAYLVSFRQHQGFHENCIERIFADILNSCQPRSLSVAARYTRRGGLDINPCRSTEQTLTIPCRTARQ